MRKGYFIPPHSVSDIPQPNNRYIRPSFANQKPIIFGFQYLDLERGKFKCSDKHGASLLVILRCLETFSKYNQIQMGQTKNYHLLDDACIKSHGLEDFRDRAVSKKLHQMGKKHTSERIIGFFNSEPNNLFEVCILDLDHKVYPAH